MPKTTCTCAAILSMIHRTMHLAEKNQIIVAPLYQGQILTYLLLTIFSGPATKREGK